MAWMNEECTQVSLRIQSITTACMSCVPPLVLITVTMHAVTNEYCSWVHTLGPAKNTNCKLLLQLN